MNDFFRGIRSFALIAFLASSFAGAQVPASSLPAGILETNTAPLTPASESTTSHRLTGTSTPSTNTLGDTANVPSRSDRDSSRSRRSDRRRDRSAVASPDDPSITSTNLPSNGTEFAAFRIIPDRNIFNVNRSSRSGRPTGETATNTVQVDTFALVGAMSYAKGDFAFFDGSNSDFRKVLKPGDSIAGFQLKSIGFNSVQLDETGKSLQLAIGSHLRREDQGEWRLVAESAPATSSSGSGERSASESSGSASGGGETKTASADSGGNADDILQRLMKKREQELGK